VATAAAAKARAVEAFMTEMVWAPDSVQESEGTVIDTLEQAAHSVREKFGSQPGIDGAVETILSASYLGLGLYDEAREHGERALALRRQALGDSHSDTLDSMHVLASVLHRQGVQKRAEELARASLQGRSRTLGRRHPDTVESLDLLAMILCAQGRKIEAERHFQRALDEAAAVAIQGHWRYHLYQGGYGECLVSLGDYARAAPLLRESYRGLGASLGRDHGQTRKALERLVRLHEGWGSPSELERYRRLQSGR
jgi:tetratricopeptide (TPR) repeat protein